MAMAMEAEVRVKKMNKAGPRERRTGKTAQRCPNAAGLSPCQVKADVTTRMSPFTAPS